MENEILRYRIKEILKERGMSQAELCRRIGMTTANLHNAFAGRSHIGISALVKIAEVLEVEFPDLFARTGWCTNGVVEPGYGDLTPIEVLETEMRKRNITYHDLAEYSKVSFPRIKGALGGRIAPKGVDVSAMSSRSGISEDIFRACLIE